MPVNTTPTEAVATITAGGLQELWIPASAMYAQTTDGAAPVTFEITANRPMLNAFDFDQTTQEAVQFNVAFPKQWDEGTVTYSIYWTANDVTANDVVWGVQATAISNGIQGIGSTFGTAVQVTDTNQTASHNLSVTVQSAALTIGATPSETDLCWFRIYRDAAAGGDTLAADARLIGIKLFYTTNALTAD